MARGRYNTKLPSKISFFKQDGDLEHPTGKTYPDIFFGPYMKKPTATFKDEKGEYIEFLLDKEGNYIRKK